MKTLIFTDLDGTLLDKTSYSPAAAVGAVKLALEKNVPIIFCSSKTRAEQLVHRRELGIRDPFIVEDGGAIFFEAGYFTDTDDSESTSNNLRVIKLGTTYEAIQRAIGLIRSETKLKLKGYADLSTEQVAETTGLDRKAAANAKQREFEETIVSALSESDAENLRKQLEKHRLRLSQGGRFPAVLGNHDKGTAVKKLIDVYQRQFGEVTSVGIGDSSNDLPMLSVVEQAVLVQKSDGTWENASLPNLRKIDAIGPEGWSKFVTDLLSI